jgi:hypothetical protein
MDNLSIEIELSELSGYSMEVVAFVNGRRLPRCLDPCILVAATKETGRVPLFTCECGEFGCGGYWVDVEPTVEAWIWRNAYVGPEPFLRFEYRIPWRQVDEAIDEIRSAMQRVQDVWPDAAILETICGVAWLEGDEVPIRDWLPEVCEKDGEATDERRGSESVPTLPPSIGATIIRHLLRSQPEWG